jgi:hypothetical protein
MRTLLQSTSSSSAISMGSMVLMPWPISGFLEMMVTMPSLDTWTNALSAGAEAGESALALAITPGIEKSSSRPPPTATLARRKARREANRDSMFEAARIIGICPEYRPSVCRPLA